MDFLQLHSIRFWIFPLISLFLAKLFIFIFMERNAFSDDYPWSQIGMTILVSLASFLALNILALFLAVPIFGVSSKFLLDSSNLYDPKNISILKYFQIVQSTSLFLVPPLLLGKLFTGSGSGYLHLQTSPKLKNVFMVMVLMVISIPVINFLAAVNSSIRLPESLSNLENIFQSAQKTAETITEAFLKVNSLQGLMVNLLMMAIIPALGEEFFFRGLLQRIFTNLFKNIHTGILVTAFLFSAIHLEFYGFIPRFLLGALLGYLFYWSGSLWLPIIGHFVNNSVAVIAYYYIHKGVIDEKYINIGSTSFLIGITFTCFAVMTGLIFLIYRNRKTC